MRVRRIGSSVSDKNQRESSSDTDDTLMAPRSALSEADAARYIGMSAAWLKKSRTKRFCRLIDAPPYIRAGTKRVVYRLDDLDEWQERHIERVGPID